MKINLVYKLASAYFISIAKLQENMSLRILHSLIPNLVGTLESPEQYYDILGEKLIPGAKEILQYGSQAIASEFELSQNEQDKQQVKSLIDSGNYSEGLSFASEKFLTDFGSATGGQLWSNFANSLLDLMVQIDKAERTGQTGDLIARLNAIDGMLHNTGDFMEKMIQQEQGYISHEEVDKLRELRDISRLPAEHVVNLMEPEARRMSDADFFRSLYKEYRKLYPAKSDAYREARKALEEMKQSRKLEGLTQEESGATFTPKVKPAPKPPRPRKSQAMAIGPKGNDAR